MGLLRMFARMIGGARMRQQRRLRRELEGLSRRKFESMEPRRMLTSDPLQIGAVYIEEDFGISLLDDPVEIEPDFDEQPARTEDGPDRAQEVENSSTWGQKDSRRLDIAIADSK